MLEEWMRSYRPDELFDDNGRLMPEIAELAPKGERRMGANPHANGGLLLKDLRMPDFREYAVDVPQPGGVTARSYARAGQHAARRDEAQHGVEQLPRHGPGRNGLEPLERRLRSDRPRPDGEISAHRRSRLARRPRHGSAERAHVPGLAGRLPAHRAGTASSPATKAFIHIIDSMFNQHAKWLKMHAADSVAAAHRVAELPADLARLAAGPQRLQPPGPRLHRSRGEQEGGYWCASICRPTPTRCFR